LAAAVALVFKPEKAKELLNRIPGAKKVKPGEDMQDIHSNPVALAALRRELNK